MLNFDDLLLILCLQAAGGGDGGGAALQGRGQTAAVRQHHRAHGQEALERSKGDYSRLYKVHGLINLF